MSATDYSVPFGRGELRFTLPQDWQVDVATAVPVQPRPPRKLAEEAFAAQVRRVRQAVIVFTDSTRDSPDDMLAAQAIHDLQTAGMAHDRIRFMCAVGMHRPSTREEKLRKLGPAQVEAFSVVDHRPEDAVTVGEVDGIPVQVNRALVEPDTLVIALGVVEPHQYAGYSGGAKTVAIGCGGVDTIAATHSPQMLGREGVRLGLVDGNPFQRFVRQAAKLTGLVRVYNAVLDANHRILTWMAGPPEQVHDVLVQFAQQFTEIPVQAPYDVVIAGVGPPKDVNLYQASRAVTYVALSRAPVIRQGGTIIMAAPVPEGSGQGTGERNFFAALSQTRDLGAMMRRMETVGCQPGEQRAYMVAQTLRVLRVVVVGAGDPEMVRQAHFMPVASMEEAVALAEAHHTAPDKPLRALIVPNAIQMLPVPVA
ncbi:MAG: nickel-dependent lactate racemase [Anaerolineae bacterium]